MGDSREQKSKGGRELDRIVFFGDAIFATAVTLLVLTIEAPEIPARNLWQRPLYASGPCATVNLVEPLGGSSFAEARRVGCRCPRCP